MIQALRRRLRHAQNSFPAGGLLLALVVGYFAYLKLRTPSNAADAAGANIAWRDIDGGEHGGDDFDEVPATVLFFTSGQCPCSDVFSAPMARLAEEYSKQGARFFAVFSNGDESIAQIRSFAAARKLGFPAVKDEQGTLATRLRSAVTPSVVILNSNRRVLFQGAVGIPPEVEGGAVDSREFIAALKTVLAGDTPPLPQTRAAGCAIIGSVTAGMPTIEPQDNRQSAGRLENGVLQLRLVAEAGLWRPEKKDGAGFPMHAWREEGKPLHVPGPLIRVPAGTECRVTIRNTLPGEPLEVHGLHARSDGADPVERIPSGEEREIRWQAGAPGTYLYWASVGKPTLAFPDGRDALLAGGLIVDPAGATPDPRERVFVLNEYLERAPDAVPTADIDAEPVTSSRIREVLAINGLTWPYTERLRYDLGEPVRWRIINASIGSHPMHLHGFHFDVLSRNNGRRETAYAEGEREKSVTELLLSGESVAIEWIPTEAGRWLFHCHMAAHFSSRLRVRPPGQGPVEEDKHKRHALDDMSGLVLGIDVQPGVAGAAKPEQGPARQLTLHVREHVLGAGPQQALSYALQEGFGGSPPPSEEHTIPGPPLVLTRGERTQIKIVNHLREPTAVHWHGIELASYYDGVVGWGGHSTSVTPSIEPGGSFVAEMSPPRAGTYIYHTHFDDERQLRAGLYGPIIVVEPGQKFDPEKERVVMLSTGRRRGIRVNGTETPGSMQLKQGETYRFRVINITLNSARLGVRLAAGEVLEKWRAVAKDGATLPVARATIQPAEQTVTVGETRDFDYTPDKPGELRLSVVSSAGLPLTALPVFVQ